MFWRTEKKTHTNTTTFCNNKKITYISKRIAYLNILSVHLIQIYFLFLRLLFISLFFYLALTSPWRACDVTYSPNPPARDVDGDVTADHTFCSCCNRCCYRVWFACFLFLSLDVRLFSLWVIIHIILYLFPVFIVMFSKSEVIENLSSHSYSYFLGH